MSLEKYQQKRDFSRTPEPAVEKKRGEEKEEEQACNNQRRFVVQEHQARRLHWDLRLEKDGVLKSWALPKGPPLRLKEKRLAVQVEDHPLDYIFFAGVIPQGNYGAGTVKIWDKGLYQILEEDDKKWKLLMKGERLEGAYVLIKTGKNDNHWLMLRYM
ncbi:MAG: 3'-phosphoesterase [Firmicutes bacterium]|nr:3'-phosphoesterase [Bacillota bacterium]